MPHRIEMKAKGYGLTGQLYDAYWQGIRIAQTTTTPFLDGCRELARRGITGPVELWSPNGTHPRMTGTVEDAAQLAVRENRTTSPRFVRYVAREWPRTAKSEGAATTLPED